MNKLIATIIAVFITLFGGTVASALTVENCAESDTTPVGVECPVDENGNQDIDEDGLYPLTIVLGESDEIPPETTVPATTVPAVLPATGSSGVSSLLQIGALFLSGGLIVAAVSRRRSTAPAA
ncbi:MAG: LPXTG-motif cell wall-anchored protein [Ilumatobacter sp.]|jgi:LPXTG-motif cell wall-anchored protein